MLGEGGVTDLKPWGRWATLGLGFIALFGGQIVALTALVWWYKLSLTRLSDVGGRRRPRYLELCT